MIQEHPTETQRSAPAIAQIYAKLPARNIARARHFYADRLGLEPYGERHNHLYYELAGAYFILFPSTGQPSGTHDQLGLVVEDLEAEVTRLKTRASCSRASPHPRVRASKTASPTWDRSRPPGSRTAKATS